MTQTVVLSAFDHNLYREIIKQNQQQQQSTQCKIIILLITLQPTVEFFIVLYPHVSNTQMRPLTTSCS